MTSGGKKDTPGISPSEFERLDEMIMRDSQLFSRGGAAASEGTLAKITDPDEVFSCCQVFLWEKSK